MQENGYLFTNSHEFCHPNGANPPGIGGEYEKHPVLL